MATSSDSERRRFHRIEDDVALRYAVLAEDKLDSALATFGDEERDALALAASFATASNQMKHALDPIKGDFPELAAYLEGLNHKLDMLVRLLAVAGEELPDEPTHHVSLSASGVSFGVPDSIPVGTILDLKLLLFPSRVCIRSLGTVVTGEPAATRGSDEPFRIRVDFSHIREADRELIIKHVIQKESSLLRRRHTEEEE